VPLTHVAGSALGPVLQVVPQAPQFVVLVFTFTYTSAAKEAGGQACRCARWNSNTCSDIGNDGCMILGHSHSKHGACAAASMQGCHMAVVTALMYGAQ
jgi:hypothetical protein